MDRAALGRHSPTAHPAPLREGFTVSLELNKQEGIALSFSTRQSNLRSALCFDTETKRREEHMRTYWKGACLMMAALLFSFTYATKATASRSRHNLGAVEHLALQHTHQPDPCSVARKWQCAYCRRFLKMTQNQ